MEFGVNTWVWTAEVTNAELASLVDTAAEMGFDLVEVPLEDHTHLDYDQAAETIQAAGLDVSVAAVMTTERDLVHESAERRRTGRQYLRRAIDATATLGGDHLVGPMYAATGRLWDLDGDERAETEATLVAELEDLARYAADQGVTLCIEPLNRFETSLLNTTAQARRVVDAVDHDACTLLLDTFHLNIEERDVPGAIRTADPYVGHIHACGNDRGAPGSGHLPWDRIAVALEEAEYDGPVVIESFTPAVESIATAAAVWRPLAPSQDDLARDGLAHLRERLA